MSVDVQGIIDVTADVLIIGTAVMGVLLVIESFDLLKEYLIGSDDGDRKPNDKDWDSYYK